ncbi:MAG: hypothetical protein JWO53_450, partial [Chlamydiia bacterium]|nr:hypothetical protein [Chlamydiia bacterium]
MLQNLFHENPNDFKKVCSLLDDAFFFSLCAYAANTHQQDLGLKMIETITWHSRDIENGFKECLHVSESTALNFIDILPKKRIDAIIVYLINSNNVDLLLKTIERTVKRNIIFNEIDGLDENEAKLVQTIQNKYVTPETWKSTLYATFLEDKASWRELCSSLPLEMSNELISYAEENYLTIEGMSAYIEKTRSLENALLAEKEDIQKIACLLHDLESIAQKDLGFTSRQVSAYLSLRHPHNPSFAKRLLLGVALQKFIDLEEKIQTTDTRLEAIKRTRVDLASEQSRTVNQGRYNEILVEDEGLLQELQAITWKNEALILESLKNARDTTLVTMKHLGLTIDDLEELMTYKALLKKSKDLFEDFLPNLRYSINTSHYATGTQKVEFPQTKPKEATIDQLLDLFDEMNFYDPLKPYYIDPRAIFADDFNWPSINQKLQEIERRLNISDLEKSTLKKEVLKTELRSTLETLVKHITKRIAYLAVPKDKETFYKNIENAFCHVIQKLKKEKGAPGLNQIHSTFIIECIRASAHCAQPVFDLAIASYSEYILGLPQDFVSYLLRELGRYREFICSSQLTPQSNESINYKNQLILALGDEFGIPGYATLKESGIGVFSDVGGAFDPKRDRKRFMGAYTPKSIFNWITDYIHATAEMKSSCKKWYINEFFENYDKNHSEIQVEFEPKRLHALNKIAEMEKNEISYDVIAESLLADDKIVDFTINIPEEIAAAVDRATEKKSAELKMQIDLWRHPPRKLGIEILEILATQHGVDVEAAKMRFLEKEAEKQESDTLEKFMMLRSHKSADSLAEELDIVLPIRQLIREVTPPELQTQINKWLNNQREPEEWIVSEL